MSKRKLTPTMYLKGRYTFVTPFITNVTFQYTCIAIRSFQDVVEEGEDVYSKYYEPNGIGIEDYNIDVGLGANIVTLLRSDNLIIHIPDTYIESYPNLDFVTYKNVVIGIQVGPIPDYVNLTSLKERIEGSVSDLVGKPGTVAEYVVPHQGTITPQEHEALEIARTAAIADRETAHAENIRLKRELVDARQKIRALEEILVNEGIIS